MRSSPGNELIRRTGYTSRILSAIESPIESAAPLENRRVAESPNQRNRGETNKSTMGEYHQAIHKSENQYADITDTQEINQSQTVGRHASID